MRVFLIICATVAALAAAVWIAVGATFPRTWKCPDVVTYQVGGVDVAWTQVIAVMVIAVAGIAAAGAGAALAGRRDRVGLATAFGLLTFVGTLALIPVFFIASTFTRTWVYTEVAGDTGGRDLVVREWAFLLLGGGEVLERDGALLTRIGSTDSDDGYLPFAAGAYTTTRDGDAVTIRWGFHAGNTAQDAVLTLPARGEPADTPSGCASWVRGAHAPPSGG